jgi:hypothetical protein
METEHGFNIDKMRLNTQNSDNGTICGDILLDIFQLQYYMLATILATSWGFIRKSGQN